MVNKVQPGKNAESSQPKNNFFRDYYYGHKKHEDIWKGKSKPQITGKVDLKPN
jgi:hypothetical protein